MKTSVVVPFVTLFVGAGRGYFAGSSQVAGEKEVAPAISSHSSSGTRPSPGSSAPSPSISFLKFAERILFSDWDERKGILAEISPENRRAHLEFLLKQSGPYGLDYKEARVINDLLDELVNEDLEGTLQWVLASDHKGNRDYLFGEIFEDKEAAAWIRENFESLFSKARSIEQPHEILRKLIGTQIEGDVLKAIQLSERHLVDHEGMIDFPSGLQEKAVGHGWETAFEYYKDNWKENNSSSDHSWSGEFPMDFDFTSFAGEWKKHESALRFKGQKGRFYEPPTYIWKVWSEQEPEAVFEFLTNGGSLTFEFGFFFDAFAKSATPEEVFELSSKVVSGPSDEEIELDRKLFKYMLNNPRNLKSLMAWSQGNGATPVTQALIKGILPVGSRRCETGLAILKIVPKEQQLYVVRDSYTIDGDFRMWDRDREWSNETLKFLGHSESEINAAIGEKSE